MRRVAKAHGLRYRGGKLVFELFPPVITNKGEGIRRLIEQHGLKSVSYLGDDVSDTDAFQSGPTDFASVVVLCSAPNGFSSLQAAVVQKGDEGLSRVLIASSTV